jgi:chromosome segregation ATPase
LEQIRTYTRDLVSKNDGLAAENERLSQLHAEAEQQNDELARSNASLCAVIKMLESRCERLESSLGQVRDSERRIADDRHEEVLQLRRQLASVAEEAAGSLSTLRSRDMEINVLREELLRLRMAVADRTAETQDVHASVDEHERQLADDLHSAQRSAVTLTTALRSTEASLDDAEQRARLHQEQARGALLERDRLRIELAESEERAHTATARALSAEQHARELASELDELRSTSSADSHSIMALNAELQRRIQVLEEAHQSLELERDNAVFARQQAGIDARKLVAAAESDKQQMLGDMRMELDDLVAEVASLRQKHVRIQEELTVERREAERLRSVAGAERRLREDAENRLARICTDQERGSHESQQAASAQRDELRRVHEECERERDRCAQLETMVQRLRAQVNRLELAVAASPSAGVVQQMQSRSSGYQSGRRFEGAVTVEMWSARCERLSQQLKASTAEWQARVQELASQVERVRKSAQASEDVLRRRLQGEEKWRLRAVRVVCDVRSVLLGLDSGSSGSGTGTGRALIRRCDQMLAEIVESLSAPPHDGSVDESM